MQQYLKLSLIAWIVYVIAYLGRMNFAALIPLIRETYGFSNTQMGLIASTLFLAYTIFQIPSGVLVDRFGIRYVFAFGSLLMAAGNLVIITWILPLMIAAQFLNGAGQSTGWSSMVKYTAQSETKSKAIGILSSAVPAGTFLAFIVASFLAEIHLKLAFIFPAVLLSILAILSLKFLPAEKVDATSLSLLKFVKDRNIAILSFTQFSVFFSMIGLFTWASAYLYDTFGIQQYEAARIASLIPLGGIVGGILGGYISHSIGEKRTIVSNQLIAALLFLLAFFTRNFVLSITILLLASIFFRFGVGATYSLAVRIAEPYSASVSGYLTFVANIGGVISTALIGSLADFGYEYAFLIFAVIFAISSMLTLYLQA
ncbi:MAG: MFS transporter [Archaeoglobus sp.]|nr:MFS transporter [Archaeoglobus sp.]